MHSPHYEDWSISVRLRDCSLYANLTDYCSDQWRHQDLLGGGAKLEIKYGALTADFGPEFSSVLMTNSCNMQYWCRRKSCELLLISTQATLADYTILG